MTKKQNSTKMNSLFGNDAKRYSNTPNSYMGSRGVVQSPCRLSIHVHGEGGIQTFQIGDGNRHNIVHKNEVSKTGYEPLLRDKHDSGRSSYCVLTEMEDGTYDYINPYADKDDYSVLVNEESAESTATSSSDQGNDTPPLELRSEDGDSSLERAQQENQTLRQQLFDIRKEFDDVKEEMRNLRIRVKHLEEKENKENANVAVATTTDLDSRRICSNCSRPIPRPRHNVSRPIPRPRPKTQTETEI